MIIDRWRTPSGPGGRLFLASFVVAAVVLSFYGGSRAFFQDESFIVWIAGSSWSHLFRSLHLEPFPPLYHILIKLWMGVGGISEGWVRAFSGVCQLAAFAAIWWLGRPLFRRDQLAAILVALIACKLITWGAIFGRMYTMIFLESSVAFLGFAALFTGRVRARAGSVVLAVANLAGMLTHYYFAFVILAQGIAYLLIFRGRSRMLFFACVVAPVVAFAVLWGPMLRTQLTSERFQEVGEQTGPQPQVRVSVPSPWSSLWWDLGDYYGRKRTLMGGAVLSLLFLTGRVRGRWRIISWRRLRSRARRVLRDPKVRLFGLFWAVTYVGLFAVYLFKGAGFYKPAVTGLLTILPLVVVLTSALGRGGRGVRLVVGLAVIAFCLVSDVRYRAAVLNDGQNNRASIRSLLHEASDGDIVICMDNYYTLFTYYLSAGAMGRRFEVVGFPEGLERHPGWSGEPHSPGGWEEYSAQALVFGGRIARTLSGRPGSRAWLVRSSWLPKTTRVVAARFDAIMHRVDQMDVHGDGFDGYLIYEEKRPGDLPATAARGLGGGQTGP